MGTSGLQSSTAAQHRRSHSSCCSAFRSRQVQGPHLTEAPASPLTGPAQRVTCPLGMGAKQSLNGKHPSSCTWLGRHEVHRLVQLKAQAEPFKCHIEAGD